MEFDLGKTVSTINKKWWKILEQPTLQPYQGKLRGYRKTHRKLLER